MRLIGHLLRADVRRFRLLLIVWLLVVAAAATVEGVRPMLAANPAVRETVGILGSLLWLAELLLMFVLGALVVQSHPLVGTDAFWMTRPIPPRTLLASKAILLGIVLIAAPVAAPAAVMIAYGVPPAQIVAVAAQKTLFQALWVIALMVAAALTPSLARFALLWGGVLVALALLVAAMLAIAMASFADSPPMSGRAATEQPTSGIVLIVLAVVAGLALLMVQYRTRSRLRSVPVGAAGLLLAFTAASAWPWPILEPALELPAWAAAESALRLAATAETVQVDEETRWPFGRAAAAWKLARARVRLSGVEPGWSADIGVLEAALQLDGRTRLASADPAYPVAAPIEGDEQHPTSGVLRRLLGVHHLVQSAPPPRGESTIVFFLREADLRRFAPASGAYRGRFEVRLIRHDVEATLPLRQGATHQHGAYRLVIDAIERTSGSISVLARESNATSIFDRRPTPVFGFYLRNQRAGDAIQGNEENLGGEQFLFRLLPFSGGFSTDQSSGFRVRSLVIRFPPSYGIEGQSFSVEDDWVEGAELVVVRSTREGSVQRTLEIADFPLKAGARSTASSTPPRAVREPTTDPRR